MTELLMREFVHHVPDFTDQSFLKEYNVLKIAALTTTSSVRLVVANLALKEPLSRLI